MIKQAQIENLFATPLYMNSLEREITLKEKNLINSFQNKTILNQSNYHTKESYVLNNKGFKDLKKFIQDHLNLYQRRLNLLFNGLLAAACLII